LELLAYKVRNHNDLELDESDLQLLPPPLRTSLDFIKDPQQRHVLEQGTAVGLAHRASLLKDRLKAREWKHMVTLWAEYLDSTAQALRHEEADDFCGPMEAGISVAKDAGFILFFIWTAFAQEDPQKPSTFYPYSDVYNDMAGKALISPFAFATDVLTFVPSSLMKLYSGHPKWHTNAHIRKSAKAFSRFARAVVSYENKYSKS
jgi:hypothetical protein